MTNKPAQKIIPVILSGGMGTRLWPMSRASTPKQFLCLNSEEQTLIQETAARIECNDRFEPPIIICNQQHKNIVDQQMRKLGFKDFKIILEPCGRNTAPALAVAAAYVQETYGDGYMLVLPADHIIRDVGSFIAAIDKGYTLAQQGHVITFGITPNAPKTGFGYIQYNEKLDGLGYKVSKFVEKPSLSKAKEYCDAGNYVWNAGIFLFSASVYLQELEVFEPEMAKQSIQAYKKHKKDGEAIIIDEEIFSGIKDESIDYALMEHTNKAAVVPVNCGWDDAGSWEALWEIKEKDEQNNVLVGQTYIIDTKNTYINCKNGPTVTTIGLDNIVIISTPDVVLVAKKDQAQNVKEMVKKVRSNNANLIEAHK